MVATENTGDDDEGEVDWLDGGGGTDAVRGGGCPGAKAVGGMVQFEQERLQRGDAQQSALDLQGGIHHVCERAVLPVGFSQGGTQQCGSERIPEPEGVFQHTGRISGGPRRPAVSGRGGCHLQHAALADLNASGQNGPGTVLVSTAEYVGHLPSM